MDIVIAISMWVLLLCVAGVMTGGVILAIRLLQRTPPGGSPATRSLAAVVLVAMGILVVGTALATGLLLTGGEAGFLPMHVSVSRSHGAVTHTRG